MTPSPARARAVAVTAVVAAIGLTIGAGLAGDESGWLLVASTVLAFVAGRRLARVPAAVAVLVLVGAGAAVSAMGDGRDLVPVVMLPLTLGVTGGALREHEVIAQRLARQAAELEAEREAFAQLSVRYERARIAAELHDVVAHAISVMVVQATAGQRLAVRDPAAADEAFRVIGAAARQASSDLERLADLLGDQPAVAADLALVEALVAQAATTGLDVTLRLDGDRDRLRGETAHVAVRVVQEGLTNALRYAPGSAVRVTVTVGPGGADVVVGNAAPARGAQPLGLGSGRGLVGLRERVEALGGTLRTDRVDGGWRLAARLPVASPVAVP